MLYESFWWPKTINDVEDLVKTCPFCQAVTPSSQLGPLSPIYMLLHPWQYLYPDLCGPFLTGEYIFTVTDAYSRYQEAVFLKDTSSKSLIKELESIFSKHGYPMTLETTYENYLCSKESIMQNPQLIGQEVTEK